MAHFLTNQMQHWLPVNTRRAVVNLAWPVILANMALPLLGIVDTAVVGHLDSEIYLAGIALGASLMAFVFWGFNFLSMGIGGAVGQALGRGDDTEIRLLLHSYLAVALTLSMPVVLFSPWLIDIGLALMDASPEVTREAAAYLKIRALGVPAILITLVIIGWFTGMQNTRVALHTQFLAQLLNIVLDVWFVLGLGWRTEGIAIGTVCSEYLAAGLLLMALKRQSEPLRPISSIASLLNPERLKTMFEVSQALLTRTLALLFSFAYFNHLAAQISNEVLAANAILLSLLTLISYLLDGMAAAAKALTGRMIGARDRIKLNEAFRVTGTLSGVMAIGLSLTFAVAGQFILSALTDQTNVLSLANEYLFWLALMPLWATPAYWLDGVFTGARLARHMRNAILFSLLLVYLPLTWFLEPLTNHQLWFSFSVFMMIRSMAMVYLWTRYYRQLDF